MLKVVQAFDHAPIGEIETGGAAALERKLQAAERVFRDRDGWLKPHQRVAPVAAFLGMASGALTEVDPHGWTQGARPASNSATILSVISS